MDPATPGTTFTYTLLVTNSGPNFAANVEVTDTLSAGVTPTGMIVTNLGDLAPGNSTSIMIDVTVDCVTLGVLTNTASVVNDVADTNLLNNTNVELTAIASIIVTFTTNNPGCWASRGVITGGPVDDYAVVAHGQVKNMALEAFNEMEAVIPFGAGSAVSNLVTGFSTNDAYLLTSLGQIKNVAANFYVRLSELGYTNGFPWADSTNAADDFAVGNIGQLKGVFNFELSY